METGIEVNNVDISNAAKSKVRAGTVLADRYLLIKEIARGGTSKIFYAKDRLAHADLDARYNQIAIKVISPDLSNGTHLALSEALTTRHLSHPNIVKIFDCHQDDEVVFISMEYLPGESLTDYMSRLAPKPMSIRQTLMIANQLCEALKYAHQFGVIHSDIKPSNIILLEDGSVKVIDFATSRAYEKDNKVSIVSESSKNFYGYTLAYASPQALLDEKAHPSDDVFSLGCVIYEMLAGEHPYGKTPSNKIDPNFKLKKPKGCNWIFWLSLKKMLQLDSKKRFQSIDELQKKLKSKKYLFSSMLFFLIPLVVAIAWYLNFIVFANDSDKINLDAPKVNEPASELNIPINESSSIDQIHQTNEEDALIREILSAPEEDRIELLSILNVLPEDKKNKSLKLLESEILLILNNNAELIAQEVTSKEQFERLLNLINKVSEFYPYSEKVIALKDNVTNQQNKMEEKIKTDIQNFWYQNGFQLNSIDLLKSVTERYRDFFNTEFSVPDSVLNTYQLSVSNAISEYEYRNIYQLYHYAVELKELYSVFLEVWEEVDLRIVEYSGQMIAYFELDSVSFFPTEAFLFFAKVDYEATKNSIERARTDLDFQLALNNILQLTNRYSIPNNSDIITELASELLIKIDGRLYFYRINGNEEKTQELLKIENQLKSLSNQ